MRLADFPLFAYLRKTRPGEKRFLLLVPLTGVVTGFAAVAFVRLLASVQKLFWGSGRSLVERAGAISPVHRFLAPLLGGILVGLVILATRRAVRGHGTSGIIEAVTQHRGYLSFKRTLIKAGATLVTVGSGGSLGREG